MPSISLSQLANFYEARPPAQVDIVQRTREQLANPDGFRRHNFWGLLHDQIRRTHLKTGAIQDFENSLNMFIMGLNDTRKKEPYQQVGRAYIEYWGHRGGELITPPPATSIDINGLEVRIRPEIGIRDTNGDTQALQLWWKNARPSLRARQVIHYCMEQARTTPAWDPAWHIGIWDLRRKSVPLAPRLPNRFEFGLSGQTAAFLQIWSMLEAAAAAAGP